MICDYSNINSHKSRFDTISLALAVGVVSEYGEILDNTLRLSNVTEEALPYPKKDIQKSIELLLNFLKNKKNSWGNLKGKYTDIAESIISNNFYRALRVGYIELAIFIPKDDANLCLQASVFLNEHENKIKNNGEMALAIKDNPWLSNALQISEEIEEGKIQRLKYLQENYGNFFYLLFIIIYFFITKLEATEQSRSVDRRNSAILETCIICGGN